MQVFFSLLTGIRAKSLRGFSIGSCRVRRKAVPLHRFSKNTKTNPDY